ncbi:MAG: DUF4276 family protein, partial [Methylomonas sp.]
MEGGGDSNALKAECRRGFSEFFKKAGIAGKMPRIVACGSRQNAYDSFRTAIEAGDDALLLVDSEAPVAAIHQNDNPDAWRPWLHLKQRQGDNWSKPTNAHDNQCHLMVQCMESWFLADRDELKKFFGQGFNENKLPPEANAIEHLDKNQIFQALADATS